jgi:hypothetical protein
VPTFCLEKPISKNMKPACIRNTSTQATATQTMSSSDVFSATVSPRLAAEAAPGIASEATAATRPAIKSLFFIEFLLAHRGSRPRRSRLDCSLPSYEAVSKRSLDGWSKFDHLPFSPMSAPCLAG